MEILIIGSGNVAWHYAKMLHKQAYALSISARNEKQAREISRLFSSSFIDWEHVQSTSADVIILAVSDQAIGSMAQHLSGTKALVVHTSGATDREALTPISRKGVIYPLQTFTKGDELKYSEIPFCIEASTVADQELLEEMVKNISLHYQVLNSEQRLRLHLAGVIACNFSNLMYSLADEVCKDYSINFQLLQPLIAQTSEKIKTIEPHMAQTGPAVRNDSLTMEKHLILLEQNHELKQLYVTLSTLIQKKATSSQK